MKQGRATSDRMASTKIEPRSQAINPSYPADLGNMRGNHAMDCGDMPFKTTPMTQGQGLKAPMAGTTTHPSGSQGRHK